MALVHLLRTLAALAVIPLGALPGLAAWLTTRDRRAAIDATISAWGRWGTRAAGISLDVRGAEHLRAPRPAVYLLNHQSGVDPMIVCALLRGGFTAVAKKEIRSNPLLGPAFAFAGVAFVDRADRTQALRALSPAPDALRGGLSLAVAPEGTRSPGAAVGDFKKGAFRIALEAGVPIVPICLHNAGDVLPRGGWLMRPATVRVTVLEPVATHDWKLERLDEEIARIRGRYLDLLQGEGSLRD
jgi:putative phosphoserine phosphatase/1-acylglycerol-3-phosphate O-acyltransferase